MLTPHSTGPVQKAAQAGNFYVGRHTRYIPSSQILSEKKMFEKIKVALGIDQESKWRKECEANVMRLPQASSRIVIGSPRYAPTKFNCEVLVATSHLLSWLEDHYSKCSVSSNAQVLILWLRKANPNSEQATYLNSELFAAIEGYEEYFIDAGVAEVVCPACSGSHHTIVREQIDEEIGGSWHSGTVFWRCPQGHKIYEDQFEHHVLRPTRNA